ncbi:hypothetical protein CFP56_026237 [Quercus suber]|uniref:Spen paralogue and orthologue SPOC C-terminal domain-containing protein n=1 Tax=Quercus suber TaxID=58331 RepID=A0AAW0K0Q8_QUESU
MIFMCSGERMPNIKWCESVEVKGKVRLEAFEKYIQDLPRSRNRGLMVISLCWKEGSSKTGLAGMKKVAKGYKEGERVGFAQLSPGIDLYICPRSETIITILAKHGFFKGMAAVEDNQDSLIGCVVWRRNRATSNTDVKKLNKKSCSLTERPVNSPSDSSAQRSAENNLSHTQPAEESIPVASATDYATLESIGNNSIESKNVKHSNAQLEFHNPSISSKPLPTPSVPSDSLSVSVGIKTSCSDCDSHQGSLGQSLEVEAPQMHNSGTKKRKTSLELQTPVLSLPSDVTKKVVSVPDDDDLPEFDFGTSSGISQTITSKPLDAYIREKKLSAEGFRNIDRSLPPTVSLIVNHRRLENSNIAQLPLGAFQKKTPLKNFCESNSISRFPIMEGKHTAQTIAVTTRGSTSAVPCAKNLFHDDDDMPEWCPPVVEFHRQSNFGLMKKHIQNHVVASPPIEICKFVIHRFERDTQSTSSCQIVMNKKEGDGDYLEVTMKQADRCIYKFQILDGVWGNNIFMKMSDLDDEVKIKLILHGIDKACYINPKSYPKIFWIKEKMYGDYKNRII